MRILFIGIFDSNEPQWALRKALRAVATQYEEIAHNGRPNHLLQLDITQAVRSLNPNLVFMQLQGAGVINPNTLRELKQSGAFLVQWTGDARQPLPEHYVTFGKQIDLSLFTNLDDVEEMTRRGARADYLQISADETIYNPNGSIDPNVPKIVFMGNNYPRAFALSDYRFGMVQFLRQTYGTDFAVYGSGWPFPTENLMYKQQREAEVYRSCKIAINCSHYDLKRYTSDRFFRILLSGAFCLSKEFPDMDEYSQNWNFATFDGSFTHLKTKIDYFLANPNVRQEFINRGKKAAHNHWTWSDRIGELMALVEKWKAKQAA